MLCFRLARIERRGSRDERGGVRMAEPMVFDWVLIFAFGTSDDEVKEVRAFTCGGG